MSNEITTFTNAEFGSIRTITIANEPWFVGKDAADILGYSNTRKALIDHVDDEDKGVTKCDTLGGVQDMTVINESGLYSLILGSKLPVAKHFKKWVTSEVLPSIRKHGLYAIDDILADPDLAIAALQELKAERGKRKFLENTVAVQTQQIAEMKPKVSYYDVVLNCKDLVAVSIIAKDYGWSAKHMNKWLHDKKIQFKQPSGIWVIEGAKKVIALGYQIPIPDCVTKAIEEYRSQNDWFGHFLDEKCEVDDSFKESSSSLYQAYRNYSLDCNEYVRSTADFYFALEKAGFERLTLNRKRFFKGLRIREDTGAEEDFLQ